MKPFDTSSDISKRTGVFFFVSQAHATIGETQIKTPSTNFLTIYKKFNVSIKPANAIIIILSSSGLPVLSSKDIEVPLIAASYNPLFIREFLIASTNTAFASKMYLAIRGVCVISSIAMRTFHAVSFISTILRGLIEPAIA